MWVAKTHIDSYRTSTFSFRLSIAEEGMLHWCVIQLVYLLNISDVEEHSSWNLNLWWNPGHIELLGVTSFYHFKFR